MGEHDLPGLGAAACDECFYSDLAAWVVEEVRTEHRHRLTEDALQQLRLCATDERQPDDPTGGFHRTGRRVLCVLGGSNAASRCHRGDGVVDGSRGSTALTCEDDVSGTDS